MDTPSSDDNKGDFSDLLFSIAGLGIFAYGCWKQLILLGLFGAVLSVTFYGQWKRRAWSEWSLLGLGIGGAVLGGLMLALNGFGGLRVAGLLCCAWIIWSQIRKLRALRAAARDAEEPMTSLVIWEREPRPLDDRILAQIVSSVWAGDYGSRDEEAACFVAGHSPVFMVKSELGMFIVHNHDRNYFDDPADVAKSTLDLRTRKAVGEHSAWLSVDLIGGPFDENITRETIYREIGRLTAELSGPNTLGILHPETQRFYSWSPELEAALKAGDGLNALDDSSLAPVIPVESDSDEMAAAIAKARERWPEFVAAFSKRHPEHLFSVKTALTVGDSTEHIWIAVDKIDDDTIHGRLGNDPVDLGDYKLDDEVSISVDEIEDWMYLLTDKPVGGFTVNVVTNAMRKKE